MMRRWWSRNGLSATVSLFGILALAMLAFACLLSGADLTTTGFSLLLCVVLLSNFGDYAVGLSLSVVAVACLSYFFIPPIFSFRVERYGDLVVLFAFFITSVFITGLAARVRRRSTEELQHTRGDLARFARAAVLGELTASIAHEINQPLAGVVSGANACRRWLAAEPPNTERASQSLDRVMRDAERASKVIERVRDLIKNVPPQKTAVSVNEAIREVILLTRGEVDRHRIKLESLFDDDLPPVCVDRIQFQQVCLNLIVNAIEAIKDRRNGPRNLSIRATKDSSNYVLITFSDTGMGINSDNIEDIFSAFYTTKPGGIGMGLAISRSIIEAHGGRLWASGSAPWGAEFQLSLPTYPAREL